MKFLTREDAQMFCTEIGRFDLVEGAGVDFQPSEEMVDLFIKKRKPLIGKLRDFRRSQDNKGSWRKNRHKIMTGIRRFHRSTQGKRFHRNLGRFLATREDLQENYNIIDAAAALKALSSAKTFVFVAMEYYQPLEEELNFWGFVEEALPLLSSIESKILTERIGEITEEEEDQLVLMTETAAMVGALAARSGKSSGEIEKYWDKAKEIIHKQYNRSEDDKGFWASVVGMVKKMSGISKKKEELEPLGKEAVA